MDGSVQGLNAQVMQAASLLLPWRPVGSGMWTDAPLEAGQQPQTPPSLHTDLHPGEATGSRLEEA